MINMYRSKKAARGAAGLILTVSLLIIVSLIILYQANYAILQQKTVTNIYNNRQAYQAAEAGLEFGISYLKTNNSTILANPIGGFLASFSNSATNNVSLANGSRFTIVYTNPIASNYKLIKITSTGTSADGSATRIISQYVQSYQTLQNIPTVPVGAIGAVTLSGSSSVNNPSGSTTIQSGSTITLSGNTETTNNSGTASTPSSTGSDVQQNVGSLSGSTASSIFTNYFGTSDFNAVKSNFDYNYTNLSNYATALGGKQSSSIWITHTSGTAAISGNVTIGSSSNPVILVVDGNLSLSGNINFYGFIFVTGGASTSILGNVNIVGGVVGASNLNITGNTSTTYNSALLNNIKNTIGINYSKVPGTWKDF